MGVEMRIFVIPRDNSFRPDGAALAAFIDALRANGWVADPTKPYFATMNFEAARHHRHGKETGALVMTPAPLVARVKKGAGYAALPKSELARFFDEHEDSDLRITWPVVNRAPEPVPLRYPLDKPSPLPAMETYYDVEIWLSREYVYVTSDGIDPLDDETCASCGTSLVFERDEADALEVMQLWRRCPKCGAPFDPSTRTAIIRDAWTNEAKKVAGGATFRFAFVIDCGKCWPNEPGLGIEPALHELCETHFAKSFYEVIEVY